MNYKLAKQLKDAGFPQEETEKCWATMTTRGTKGHWSRQVVVDLATFHTKQGDAFNETSYKDKIACPTLEELIDEIVNHADKVRNVVSFDIKYTWTVNTIEFPSFEAILIQGKGCGEESNIWQQKAEGLTPTEAVAKLYITLNQPPKE